MSSSSSSSGQPEPSTHLGGRKLGELWPFFRREEHKKGFHAVCLACLDAMMGKQEVMARHLLKCSASPDAAKERAQFVLQKRPAADLLSPASSPSSPEASSASPQFKKPRELTFEVKDFSPLTKGEQEALDRQVMRMFASGNLPFAFADDPEFKAFCRMLGGPLSSTTPAIWSEPGANWKLPSKPLVFSR